MSGEIVDVFTPGDTAAARKTAWTAFPDAKTVRVFRIEDRMFAREIDSRDEGD